MVSSSELAFRNQTSGNHPHLTPQSALVLADHFSRSTQGGGRFARVLRQGMVDLCVLRGRALLPAFFCNLLPITAMYLDLAEARKTKA